MAEINHEPMRVLELILHEVLQLKHEVRKMADTQQQQDAQLTSDITALTTAFTNYTAAVQAEIAVLQGSPAASDPVVAQAITNIEALTAQINADTASATPSTPTSPSTPSGDPSQTQ
jgi:hypothetical protein